MGELTRFLVWVFSLSLNGYLFWRATKTYSPWTLPLLLLFMFNFIFGGAALLAP